MFERITLLESKQREIEARLAGYTEKIDDIKFEVNMQRSLCNYILH